MSPTSPIHFGPVREAFLVAWRRYPVESALAVLCLTVSAFLGGVALSAILPVLKQGLGDGGAAVGPPGAWIVAALAWLGIAPTIGALLLFVVGTMLAKGALRFLGQAIVACAAASLATGFRKRLIDALLQADWQFHVREPVGSLSHALGGEAKRLAKGHVSASTVYAEGVQALIYLAVAFALSWHVGVVAMALGAVLLVALSKLLRDSRLSAQRQSQVMRAYLSRLTDGFRSVKTAKAMNRAGPLGDLLAAEVHEVDRLARRMGLTQALTEGLQEPLAIVAAAGIAYLALAVFGVDGAAFITMAIAFQRTIYHVMAMQRGLRATLVANTSYWILSDVAHRADAAREMFRGSGVPRLRHALALRGVSVDRGRRRTLGDVSLEIPAGRMTLLIGPSGSGKTTIADLICGILSPDAGDILVDGTPLRELDMMLWRRRIGYVSQELALLNDTVFANVALGLPDASEAEAERALREAGAWEFVSALPQGIRSNVGEAGQALSGGQRQRILIARALVTEPDLLILDEPTTALDPVAEAALCDMIQTLVPKHTVFAISHQTALRRVADQVLQLGSGAVHAPSQPSLSEAAG